MKEFGYAIDELSYNDWRTRLVDIARLAEQQQKGGASSPAPSQSSTSSSSRHPRRDSSLDLTPSSSSGLGGTPTRRRRFASRVQAPLAHLSAAAADNALLPLLPIFSENEADMGNTESMPVFNAAWTLRQCDAVGVPCPIIDDELLTVYFEYYISSGFLAPPQRVDDQFSLDSDI
jgi:hypothetical protein